MIFLGARDRSTRGGFTLEIRARWFRREVTPTWQTKREKPRRAAFACGAWALFFQPCNVQRRIEVNRAMPDWPLEDDLSQESVNLPGRVLQRRPGARLAADRLPKGRLDHLLDLAVTWVRRTGLGRRDLLKVNGIVLALLELR